MMLTFMAESSENGGAEVLPEAAQGVIVVEQKLGLADWALSPLYRHVHRSFFRLLHGHGTPVAAASLTGGEWDEFEALLRALLLLNPKIATAWNVLSVPLPLPFSVSLFCEVCLCQQPELCASFV